MRYAIQGWTRSDACAWAEDADTMLAAVERIDDLRKNPPVRGIAKWYIYDPQEKRLFRRIGVTRRRTIEVFD